MFFGNIGSMFETYEVTLEIYIGNQIINKQTMEAPKEMLQANFMQLTKQIANDTRPMKIRMIKPEVIWDNFDKKQKTLTNEICFSNTAMISFEKESEENSNNKE